MTRLAVLGAGSAFTAALLRALAAQPSDDEPDEVRLWGGDERALRLLALHGTALQRGRGGSTTAHRDLAQALDGATVVLHQIRYGGLPGRAAAERLASLAGVAADETLGPGGLLTALLTADGLGPVAAALRTSAPRAPVVMMTNPLSVSTALLHEQGVRTVLGSCELPEATARASYAIAGSPYHPGGWHCTGLNHRGFLHAVEDRDGRDLRPAIVEGLRARGDVAGAQDVRELDAVPTKYFALACGRARPGGGRAEALSALRTRILAELAADPTSSPVGLRERPTPWYDDAVVPLVRALRLSQGRRLVLTLPGEGGLARERTCLVSADGVQPLPAPAAPPAAQRWLDRFEEHEQAVLAAVGEPSLERVRAALSADPCVPADVVQDCASSVLEVLRPAA